MEVTCVDISEMPYSYCDMDCDQEFNKSDIEEHCSDCLCVGGLEDLDQQDMPATKAWRPTSVVKERNRPKTLSKVVENCRCLSFFWGDLLIRIFLSICQAHPIYK